MSVRYLVSACFSDIQSDWHPDEPTGLLASFLRSSIADLAWVFPKNFSGLCAPNVNHRSERIAVSSLSENCPKRTPVGARGWTTWRSQAWQARAACLRPGAPTGVC